MLGSTVFILFIMLIAAANLCLGFAAAVAFGLGPQRWPTFERRPVPAKDDAPREEARVPTSTPANVASTPTVPQVQLTPSNDPAPINAAPLTLAEHAQAMARTFELFNTELTDWDQRRQQDDVAIEDLNNAAIELGSLASGYLEQFQTRCEAMGAELGDSTDAQDAHAEVRAVVGQLAQQISVLCAELGSLQFEQGDSLTANEKLTNGLTEVQAALSTAQVQLQGSLRLLEQ